MDKPSETAEKRHDVMEYRVEKEIKKESARQRWSRGRKMNVGEGEDGHLTSG